MDGVVLPVAVEDIARVELIMMEGQVFERVGAVSSGNLLTTRGASLRTWMRSRLKQALKMGVEQRTVPI